MPSGMKYLFYYERQSELDGRPDFDTDSMIDDVSGLVHELRQQEAGLNEARARIEFDITLPTKERDLPMEGGSAKKKRKKTVKAVHEQDAALGALHYADSLFSQMLQQDDQYLKTVWEGTPTFEGFRLEPDPRDGTAIPRLRRRVVSPEFRVNDEFNVVLSYFTHVLFDSEESCHYDEVMVRVTLGDSFGIQAPLKREKKERKYSLDAVQEWYSKKDVRDILFERSRDREVLFSFSNRSRPGITVDSHGWLGVLLAAEEGQEYKPSRKDRIPLEFSRPEDIADSVFMHGLVDIIPAGNKKEERVCCRVSLETDPGNLFQKLLGKQKAWEVNTYVAQEMCTILDAYKLEYVVKFSGNKGWHIEIDTRLTEPPGEYKRVVEFIAAELMDDGKQQALELSKYKEYSDPFFFARRFVDVVGAKVMFSSMKGLLSKGVLDLSDLRKLSVPVRLISGPEYETELWKYQKSFDPKATSVPWVFEQDGNKYKVKYSDIASINPYSKLKRTTKMLIDHSSNKYRGKLRALFSVNPKSGCVSLPMPHTHGKDGFSFSADMWDYARVRDISRVDNVVQGVDSEGRPVGYDWVALARQSGSNKGTLSFDRFSKDNRDWFYYLLKNGAESGELMEDYSGLWVDGYVWDKENEKRIETVAAQMAAVKDPGKASVPAFTERSDVLGKNPYFVQAYLNSYERARGVLRQYDRFVKDQVVRLEAQKADPQQIKSFAGVPAAIEAFMKVDLQDVDTVQVVSSVYGAVEGFVKHYWSEPEIYKLKKVLVLCNQTLRKVMVGGD